MATKYRVILDEQGNYRPQYKNWWTFWINFEKFVICDFGSYHTHVRFEKEHKAKQYIKDHCRKVASKAADIKAKLEASKAFKLKAITCPPKDQ